MAENASDLRERLRDRLVDALAPREDVLAIGSTGSDATGRTYEHSDLDLAVVVAEGAAEEVLAAARQAVEELAPVRAAWRIPEPAWHGFSQVFLSFEGWPESLMLDLAVIPVSVPAERRFLERERHGEAEVLHDPGGLLAPRALDRDAHLDGARAALETLRARAALFGHMPAKALARGHLVEAAAFHQSFVVGPLVQLLRLRHCPDRFDYGPRYLDRDLPDEARELLEQLSFAADAEALSRAVELGRARLADELADLDAGRWSL